MKWRERLNRKRTPEGVMNLQDDASAWATCAVGERHVLLEEAGCTFSRGSSGRLTIPDDEDVSQWGIDFAGAVEDGDKWLALFILDDLDTWIGIRRT